LVGAEAIAEFTGLKPRQVYWQFEAGNLPLVKLGRLLVGSKAKLRRVLTGETA
jgi:hypothetical protein